MNYRCLRIPSALCALALAIGCGQTQNSSIPPLLQTSPLASSGSLLYVLGKLQGRKLSVYSFPGGAPHKHVLMPTDGWAYLCSDDRGNVYVPAYNVIFKYAHGGQRPVGYLDDKGGLGGQCAADPKTGNLAINDGGGIKGCYVAVYMHAKGKPTCLKQLDFIAEYPSYDNNGNLFFNYGSGSKNALGEVLAGSSKFLKITLNEKISDYYDLQWDGQDIAIQTKLPGTEDQPVVIKRVHISGTKGTVVKTIRFQGWTNQTEYFWISSGLIVAPLSFTALGIWNYPQGGKRVGSITMPNIWAWTVSVSP